MVDRMIIESGYDVFRILLNGFPIDELRVAAFDADLRPVVETTAVAAFSGEFDDSAITAVESILDAADFEVRFVAVGYGIGKVDSCYHWAGDDAHRPLREMIEARGARCLGIFVADGEYWATTGPAHGFESYLEGESMPRTIVIPGPHPLFTCTCVYCGPRNHKRESARRTGSCTIEE